MCAPWDKRYLRWAEGNDCWLAEKLVKHILVHGLTVPADPIVYTVGFRRLGTAE